MNILNFPAELLENILKLCTTTDYLQLIRTCRGLYAIGTHRSVVSHHIYRNPGFDTMDGRKLDFFSTHVQFRELRKRSAYHLLGASLHSEMTLYSFRDVTVDTRASNIFQSNRTKWDSKMPSIAIVSKSGDSVHLYCTQRNASGSVAIALQGILAFPYEHPGNVEILHVVPCHFDDRVICVLQRYKPANEMSYRQTHQPVGSEDDSVQAFFDSNIHLVHYKWSRRAKSWSVKSLSRFPGWDSDYFPCAMEPLNEDIVAISWKYPKFDDTHGALFLHRPHYGMVMNSNGCKYMEYLSCEISYEGYGWGIPTSQPEERLAWSGSSRATPEPITRICYDHDRSQLYYFHLSSLVPNNSQVLTFQHWDEFEVDHIAPNVFAVGIPSCRRTLQLEVGEPFYRAHLRIGSRTGVQCGWCCLAFGVTAYKSNDTGLTTAYLLRSDGQCRGDNFGYYSHSDDGEIYPCWTVVAKLLDFDQVGSRSGGLIRYSRLGTRIAVASGKGVHIWPLEPNELLKRNVDEYYPPTMQCRLANRDESDDIDISGNANASEVKRDANAHQGLVVALKPMSLELDGDCLAMRFLDGEDDLSILTGAGLMIWKLDACGTGYRSRNWI